MPKIYIHPTGFGGFHACAPHAPQFKLPVWENTGIFSTPPPPPPPASSSPLKLPWLYPSVLRSRRG